MLHNQQYACYTVNNIQCTQYSIVVPATTSMQITEGDKHDYCISQSYMAKIREADLEATKPIWQGTEVNNLVQGGKQGL